MRSSQGSDRLIGIAHDALHARDLTELDKLEDALDGAAAWFVKAKAGGGERGARSRSRSPMPAMRLRSSALRFCGSPNLVSAAARGRRSGAIVAGENFGAKGVIGVASGGERQECPTSVGLD
jgi:hypothetical protein